MIGSAVSKGMDSLGEDFLSSKPVVLSSENQTQVVLNETFGNFTGNQSETTTRKSISTADDTSEMSPEELDLRLQFAMSVTFMVGVIQVRTS
jgi:hypothetical protein